MSTTDAARAARLKAALRDNLRRRKAQARGRAGDGAEEGPGEAGTPTPEEDRGPERDAERNGSGR